MEDNFADGRAYALMASAAVDRLAGRLAADIAARTGMAYDAPRAELRLTSLGREMAVAWPSCGFTPADVPACQRLVILHCMDMADGAPLTGRELSASEMRDGMTRGGGFNEHCERVSRERVGPAHIGRIKAACGALGGELVRANSDICAVFHLAPSVPIKYKLWLPCEDLSASGRMFFDANIDHYLTIEDAVTVGTLILEGLVERIERIDGGRVL